MTLCYGRYRQRIPLPEANELVNSLKICDPAVGSGHFLVSALNEIIAIKSELHILADSEGKLLRCDIAIENDELIVTVDDQIFTYNYKDAESQRLQETLFHEKEAAIENCLFGVDINAKSVAICRLRLWIELLKNAYYRRGSDELETLPNIDINIKCGNTLVSRFALGRTPNLLATSQNKLKELTEKYRRHVFEYKLSPANKAQLRNVIENLKHMGKLRAAGKPLGEYVDGKFYYGIKTGLNEAFVIDEETKARLIAEDPKSAEIIKPWLRGRDIRKWKAELAGLHVLYIPWHFEISKYHAVEKHLLCFQEQLEKRNASERGRYEWYALQRYAADYFQEFDKQKIVYQEIATYQSFGYAEPGTFCNNKCFIIPRTDDFLLAIVNCKLPWWFLGNLTSSLAGGARAMQTPYMAQLPIPLSTATQQAPIIALVEQILATPDSPAVPQLEAEIDRLVYALYGLTEAEIAVVEGKK